MKKVLLLLIPVIILIAGCSESGLEPTSPITETQKSIVQLPPSSDIHIENLFSVSEVIDGSRGGMIKLDESYNSQTGQVKIKAKLKIPKNAFTGTETIGYQINEDASIDFFPGMNFDTDLQYDIKFSGLDLSGIDPNDVRFLYQAPDGTTYPVQYSDLIVDVDRGILEVKNAVIHHFSRYIWGR
ncbi:MAG TPA: hypothetical protein VI230_07770 [Ignavibacteriaceae bacterium]